MGLFESEILINYVGWMDLSTIRFVIVGLFVATWVFALGFWRVSRIEVKWTTHLMPAGQTAD
ncbi:hypothetical protein GXW83_15150 [Streptacidiphilus sp. PB12-B1b]|uniref:hypothetical protein n=1 Tax=Streptacidiphilus sp. PB12-B1b TaxID=2705012 RepID=UPI0015FDC60E|nr:hypothetical protein [Streptacidiphilus sp. PB12-B1b]QMU76868.1 hypothetical protein GXW83_15150 [Streptacidiphilus sp. PB12-B1b]